MNDLTRQLGAHFWLQRLIGSIVMRKHIMVFRKQIKTADKTIETLHKQLLRAHDFGIDTLIPNFQAGLYVAVVLRDLSTLLIQMIHARSLWERRLCVRHMSVMLYEAGLDVPKLLGWQRLRSTLKKLDEWKDIEKKLNSASKQFRIAYDANRKYLKDIRNNAAAHYDIDAVILVETIQNINPNDILTVVSEMSNGLNQVMNALTYAINQSRQEKYLLKYAARKLSED